ncbi:MAG: MFS transporter [Thermoplasmata archaeon]
MNENLKGIIGKYTSFSDESYRLIRLQFIYGLSSGIFGFLFIFYLSFFGYSPLEYGLLISVQGIAYIVSIVPSGVYASRIGAKRMIILGIIVDMLAYPMLSFVSYFYILVLASALIGLSSSFVNSSFSSLISKSADESIRKYVFSLSSFFGLIGNTIGNLMGGILPEIGVVAGSKTLGYRMLPFLLLFLILLALFISIRIKLDIKLRKKEQRPKLDSKTSKLILKLIIPASLIGFGAGFLIPYFQLQFKYRFNINVESISFIFALTNLVMAFVILFVPFIAERRGSVFTIVTFQSLATLTLLIMPFIGGLRGIGLSLFTSLYIFRTLMMNVSNPVQTSFELSLIPEEHRPFMSSLVSFSWTGLNSVSTLVGGYLIMISLNIPFYITASFYFTSSVLYIAFFGKMKMR